MVNQEKGQINKRLYLFYSIAFVIALIVLGITGTYAFFRVTVTKSETLSNINASLDCINITYSETGTIDLDYQYPVSDEYAQSHVIPLIVNVTNNCSSNIDDVNYVLTMATLAEDNYINDNQMRIQVKRKLGSNTEEIFKTPGYLSSLAKLETGNTYNYMLRNLSQRNDTKDFTIKTIYRIDNNTIGDGETNTYKIYLWIDYWEGDTTKTGLKDNTTMEKDFKATISLVINSYQMKEVDVEFAGDGTNNNPYQIRMIEDLVKLSNSVGSGTTYNGDYFKLIRNLDFNNKESYENANRTDFGDLNGNGIIEPLITELTTGKGFTPIGGETYIFGGNFNGNNKIIDNLYINNTTLKYAGLFARITNSNISNLTVGGEIQSTIKVYAGGIVGGISGTTTLTNCHNRTNITVTDGSDYAIGGILGAVGTGSTVSVTNCTNGVENDTTVGNISGSYSAGGLVGYVNNLVNITNSVNYGTITNNVGRCVAGIVGRSVSSSNVIIIDNTRNFGNISGNKSAIQSIGGIAGSIPGSITIRNNTYNNGEIRSYGVSGEKRVGGLIGGTSGPTIISNSSNRNIVENNISTPENSNQHTGGIIGYSSGDVTINYSYNSGAVTTNGPTTNNALRTGGLVGYNSGSIIVSTSGNTGNITGGVNIGGVIGAADGTSFIADKVYNTGNVSFNDVESTKAKRAGGIIGNCPPNSTVISYVLNSYNSGNVFVIDSGETYVGGLFGLLGSSIYVINSFNTGNISSSNYRANGIGYSSTSSSTTYLNNVYSNGSISSPSTKTDIGLLYGNSETLINGYCPSTSTITCSNVSGYSQYIPDAQELNSNIEGIDLEAISLEIKDYTLSSWKTGPNGYPVFDD